MLLSLMVCVLSLLPALDAQCGRILIDETSAGSTGLRACVALMHMVSLVPGFITDGPSSYPENTQCEWLITGLRRVFHARPPHATNVLCCASVEHASQYSYRTASRPNATVTLTFLSYATECAYDFLFIYDSRSSAVTSSSATSTSSSSSLLAAQSGDTLPEPVVSTTGEVCDCHTLSWTDASLQMLIVLYSDANYVLAGINISYSITHCDQRCVHGSCVWNRCVCEDYWSGLDCATPICPRNCSFVRGVKSPRSLSLCCLCLQSYRVSPALVFCILPLSRCSGHGVCDVAQRRCVCSGTFHGDACDASVSENQWYTVSAHDTAFAARMFHTVNYDAVCTFRVVCSSHALQVADRLYALGGQTMRDTLGSFVEFSFEVRITGFNRCFSYCPYVDTIT